MSDRLDRIPFADAPTLTPELRAELQFCAAGECGHCDHYSTTVATILERETAAAYQAGRSSVAYRVGGMG